MNATRNFTIVIIKTIGGHRAYIRAVHNSVFRPVKDVVPNAHVFQKVKTLSNILQKIAILQFSKRLNFYSDPGQLLNEVGVESERRLYQDQTCYGIMVEHSGLDKIGQSVYEARRR